MDLEASAAFGQAAQARYPPLLQDVQIIARPTFEAKEEAPKNNPGMLGSLAEAISWLMTATGHLEPDFCFDFVLGRTLRLQDICSMHDFGIKAKSMTCLTLTYHNVQQLACRFYHESSVG